MMRLDFVVPSSVEASWRTNAACGQREDEKMSSVVFWDMPLQLAVHQSKRKRDIEQQGEQTILHTGVYGRHG